jgi:hypothetical protein
LKEYARKIPDVISIVHFQERNEKDPKEVDSDGIGKVRLNDLRIMPPFQRQNEAYHNKKDDRGYSEHPS